jgi:hypothetical protein
MRKTLAAAVAALGLIGWADPKTAMPDVSKDAAAQEAKREAAYVYAALLKEERRVRAITFRLAVANQDLCADRKPRLGLYWDTAERYGSRERAAAVEGLGLKDGLTVIDVVPDSPAAQAGVQRQDVVVSMAGEAVPTGRAATEAFDKRLDKLIGASVKPIEVVVRRGDVQQTITVTPVLACAYDAVVEDSQELNAKADGHVVHIYRPMLRLAATDEELALVIGHELAHNGQHHLQAQAHNARLAGLGGLLLDGVAAAGGVNTQGAFTKAGMRIGAAHASVQFEEEADYVGLYYMARAGYPTDGAEDFWRKMAVENPQAIFIKSDHPVTPERFLAIAAASREIEAKRAKNEPLVPNARTN